MILRFRLQPEHAAYVVSFSFVKLPQTNGVVERFNRTLKEQAIYGCQSALKIDPPSASNIDPPKRVMFA